MRTLNYLLLPVRNPRESAKLYTRLLGCSPVTESDSFALFALPSGLKVGLWIASEMTPTPMVPGGLELAFTEASREAVLETFGAWKALGLEVLLEPTDLPFGFSFVVKDPDGHRLRPFVLAAAPR